MWFFISSIASLLVFSGSSFHYHTGWGMAGECATGGNCFLLLSENNTFFLEQYKVHMA